MVNFKFAWQHCQSWQPEMRLDYGDTKIIEIFIVANRFSHFWSRCIYLYRIIHVRWRAWPGKNATQNTIYKVI
jgi:hypothetical protein